MWKSVIENNVVRKVLSGLAWGILFILPILFIIGIYFLGFAGVFAIFGIGYESKQTLFIFVTAYFLLTLVLDFFAVLLYQFTSSYVSGSSKQYLLRMFFDMAFSWFALHTVVELTPAIQIPFLLEIGIVLFIFLIEEAINGGQENRSYY